MTGTGKGKRCSPYGSCWLIVMVFAIVSMLFGPPALQAQQDLGQTTIGTFTDVPTTMTASSTSNVNSGVILVRQHRGIALLPVFTGSAASTGNITIKWDVSSDGTNYTTTQPISLVIPANGTNTVIGWTNVPSTYLNNVRYLRVASVQNAATNSLTGVSVGYSYANDPPGGR